MNRRATTLLESLAALVLFTALAIPTLTALQTGASTTARSGEHQLATLVAARALDALVLAPTASTRTITIDGIPFTATATLTELAPGLAKATLTVTWPQIGSASNNRLPLRVTRLIATPLRLLEPR